MSYLLAVAVVLLVFLLGVRVGKQRATHEMAVVVMAVTRRIRSDLFHMAKATVHSRPVLLETDVLKTLDKIDQEVIPS